MSNEVAKENKGEREGHRRKEKGVYRIKEKGKREG